MAISWFVELAKALPPDLVCLHSEMSDQQVKCTGSTVSDGGVDSFGE